MTFYDIMSLSKKRNLDTTLQVYTLDQLDPNNVGVWGYKHEEVKSDPRVTFHKIAYIADKMEQVKIKHKLDISTIFNIILDDIIYKTIDVLRDYVHEKESPWLIQCTNDKEQYETRWNRFYVDRYGQFYKGTYCIRVNRVTKDSVLNLITFYIVKKGVILSHPTLKSKYFRVIQTFETNSLNESVLRFFNKAFPIKEDKLVKFRHKDTKKVLDLTKEDLYNMPHEDLYKLEHLEEDALPILVHAMTKDIDLLKMDKFYDRNDRVNDPTGFLREDYLSHFDMRPINEENLLKFGNINIDIYNLLLDMKYDECGGREVINDDYAYDHWPQVYDAINAIGYGNNQRDVYNKLCSAFGKEKVDTVWYMYYRDKDDGFNNQYQKNRKLDTE